MMKEHDGGRGRGGDNEEVGGLIPGESLFFLLRLQYND